MVYILLYLFKGATIQLLVSVACKARALWPALCGGWAGSLWMSSERKKKFYLIVKGL